MSFITSVDFTYTCVIWNYKRQIDAQNSEKSLLSEKQFVKFMQHLLISEEELEQKVVFHFFELDEVSGAVVFEEVETGNVVFAHYVLLYLIDAPLENGKVVSSLGQFL